MPTQAEQVNCNSFHKVKSQLAGMAVKAVYELEMDLQMQQKAPVQMRQQKVPGKTSAGSF